MTTEKTKVPRVVHTSDLSEKTAQTLAMHRRAAIHAESTGASKIWMGWVTNAPGMDSGTHHHGEAETAAYIVSGRVGVRFGEGFKEYVEAGPGDFLFVPAWTPHIEVNPSAEEPSEVIVSRAPDNIVVNLG
jgi:uncharacterized RmlC-like cupin family protein